MAFEGFLTQDKVGRPRGRRIFHTVSIAIHGVLIVIGIIYSFWHVDELTPPNVTVTFMSAPPPPPPPPPPPKRKSSKKQEQKPQEIVQPKPDQIVQPKEEPEPEPEKIEEDDGGDDGVEGGVEGGVVGGTVGGVVGGDISSTGNAPKFLPPNVGEKQVLNKVEPVIPPVLAKSGMLLSNMMKICVDRSGTVTDVTLMKPSDKLFDDACAKALRQWRFSPLLVNGRPNPFCYMQKNILKAQ